jgi:hypothetical protein
VGGIGTSPNFREKDRFSRPSVLACLFGRYVSAEASHSDRLAKARFSVSIRSVVTTDGSWGVVAPLDWPGYTGQCIERVRRFTRVDHWREMES